jgi:hypothetical protein
MFIQYFKFSVIVSELQTLFYKTHFLMYLFVDYCMHIWFICIDLFCIQ